MSATCVLLGLLLAATITDLRRRKVYNWITYPGVLLALIANGLATAWGLDPDWPLHDQLGLIGLQESLAGCVLCGFIMLVCYVFFPGGVGGGDVKLLAMMGALPRTLAGLEALLWTFVLGACAAIGLIVWRVGTLRLLTRAVQIVASLVRFRVWTPLSGDERASLKTDVFLSPAALAAVVIVQFQLSRWF